VCGHVIQRERHVEVLLHKCQCGHDPVFCGLTLCTGEALVELGQAEQAQSFAGHRQ